MNQVADLIWFVFAHLVSVQYISYVSQHSFMSSELSFKEFFFIFYFFFSHNSGNRFAVPDNDVNQDKVGLKVEYEEDKNKKDENDMEVLEEDVDRTNDKKEENRTEKTKEEIPKIISFVKGVVDSDDLLPLPVNRETLQQSRIIKFISKKLVSKDIDMLRKLEEKEKSKKQKDYNIEYDNNEVGINNKGEVVETNNDELVVDAAYSAPPPQEAPTTITTTSAAAQEGGDDNNVVAQDINNNDDEEYYTNGEQEGGQIPRSKTAEKKMMKTTTTRMLCTFYPPYYPVESIVSNV